MKLSKLTATKVHGHLKFDLEFHPNLTFLIGLNGSGKTTALKLLMGLLTPDLKLLWKIQFETARIEATSDDQAISISATREGQNIELTVSTLSEKLYISEMMIAALDHSDGSPELYQDSEVLAAIRALTTPMYLGLERRLELDPVTKTEYSNQPLSYINQLRHISNRAYESSGDAVFGGVKEVNGLIVKTMRNIRRDLEILDQQLRTKLLSSALQFIPTSPTTLADFPDSKTITAYKNKLNRLRDVAATLGIATSDIVGPLNSFFQTFDKLVTKHNKKPSKENTLTLTLNWILNKNQIDRLIVITRSFEDYDANKAQLFAPIDKLKGLLNSFFRDTSKTVDIVSDELVVKLSDNTSHPLASLSSGERQLCVMLGQLALNPRLHESGIFIVDEPELSLHMSWQEMFVDSVREANLDVQLIFATHSPAIILDKYENCRMLGASHD